MIRSMYSGVSGMRGFQTKLDVIGNNIANVNTAGFKAGRVTFKDIMSQTVSGTTAPGDDGTGGVNAKQIGLGSVVASIDNIHTGGSAMTTNRPLDLRIDGDGFFAVRMGEDGATFFTRAGDFHLDANRQLVTSDGLRVLDAGGEPITLDEEIVAFTIGQNGEIVAKKDDGTTEATGVKIGIAKIPNPEGLEKVGGNLYRLTPNAIEGGTLDEFSEANDPEAGTGAIISGQLEMSNVDLTSEFTEMIVAQRGFQANSRIITTSDEVLQEVVNLKR
ncbi:flagellar basal-body rod protein FlgF [Paenibacillus alvei]|uniref:Flagellar basal-body rod protein FlgF n=2 Tax=Paenibacillus TaxID=44249 RepID=A0AAP6ZVN1_PAEAL|nr:MULTISPECIES: flagellar basal body rod protein FlgG [Paenibacillus]EJW15596.1 flagellar basal-body rod protein FlgG [Paenibacillus alvei DSM 29]MBG9733173.1 flagellar basal body rod protein FlgG [Paenibacillus alvei]MBG9745267.1 flagellar basal body rod protein FlgG [Paenibacillus alvei]MCY7486497.1 flagellar basal-body rod protein FlgF [Paenibacillus alvei]MCY9542588.1 flagellar basal-body rod protein FlgF [Paenibacillus alvei]